MKVLLCVLDGLGLREEPEGNAFALSASPNLKGWLSSGASARLQASGRHVGLPDGVMGNSEVGHLAMGSGRAVDQDLVRIDKAAETGLARVPAIRDALERGRTASLHLLGLLSDGGVHSHERHLHALLAEAAKAAVRNVFVHAILDGRDTPPRSADRYLASLGREMARLGTGELATVSGRYYAMDRDERWDRTKLAYDALVLGAGPQAPSAGEALTSAYARGETDEFVKPTITSSRTEARLRDGDAAIFFNFRADRARQLTRALSDASFQEFRRDRAPRLHLVTMTRYDASIPVPAAFPPEAPRDTVGEIVSRQGLRQLRIAETEKYAHVTYFFNGGREEPFRGEERILVPSKREVSTYDRLPEMSAPEITRALLPRLPDGPELIVLNYANVDMVGHTGLLPAAIKACEVVDACLGDVVPAARQAGYEILITSDHGNVERMMTADGTPHTAHTTNAVPVVYIGSRRARLRDGELADIGATILDLLGIPRPEAMTGRSLLTA